MGSGHGLEASKVTLLAHVKPFIHNTEAVCTSEYLNCRLYSMNKKLTGLDKTAVIHTAYFAQSVLASWLSALPN